MSTRYLEFDSSYRDRNVYPSASSFTVEISQSGQLGNTTAKDVVSNASPIWVWNSSFREDAAATVITVGAIAGTPINSDTLTVTLSTAQVFRNVEGFYVGAILVETATLARMRITAYKRISTVLGQFTLDTAINATFAGGTITNPTNDTSSGGVPPTLVPQVFVPSSVAITNYFKGYVIKNETTAEVISITAFDATTRLATLASNTAATWLNANQNFSIRKEAPTNTGVIDQISTNGLFISLGSGSTAVSAYTGGFLRMLEPIPVAGTFSTQVAPYNQERKIAKYISGSGTFTAIAASTFTLAIGASTEDDYYVGGWLVDSTAGITRQVLTYTGSTRSGTVSVAWGGGAAGDSWVMRTAQLASAFSTNPVVGGADSYEVEQFTRDNCNPFAYTGSLVSSNQECCYEVELLNLILPNLTLSSGRGGRPVFYPYLYVELQAVSGSSGLHKNVIYSNNPNSTKMLFRAVVDDTTAPLVSPFIKIDGDGMVHVVKFKPNDSFRFAVYHTDGTNITYSTADFFSPKEPNPLVQISACFAFKPA